MSAHPIKDESVSKPRDLFRSMLPSQRKISRTLQSISSSSNSGNHWDYSDPGSLPLESITDRPEFATGKSRTFGQIKSGDENKDFGSVRGETSGLGSTHEMTKQMSVDFENNPDCMSKIELSDSGTDRRKKVGKVKATKEDNDLCSIDDRVEETRRGESPGDNGNQAIDDDVSIGSSSYDSSDDTDMEETTQLNPEPPTSEWDAFAEIPWVTDHEINESCFALFRRIFKVITYIFIFSGVLLLTIVSKGSVVMAVSKLRPFPSNGSSWSKPDLSCRDIEEMYAHKVTGNGKNGSEAVTSGVQWVLKSYTLCVTIPRGYGYNLTVGGSQFSCLQPLNKSGEAPRARIVDSYLANECVVSRIYWAWSLYLMICSPFAFIFLRSVWRLCFRTKNRSKHLFKAMVVVLIVETLHVIGLTLLVFLVLPSLDNTFQMVMFMLGVAFLPGSLKILLRPVEETRGYRVLKVTCGVMAVLGQLSAVFFWPVLVGIYHEERSYDWKLTWSIPLSLILISVRWWENFVDKNLHLGRFRKPLLVLAGQIRRSRIKIQMVASLWKMVVCLVMMMVCIGSQIKELNHNSEDYSWTQAITAVFNFDLR